VAAAFGIEFDVRYYQHELAIHHDPFVPGQAWGPWLDAYRHRFMVANIKSEGVEATVIKELEGRNITDYFMLDMSLPFMVKYSRQGFHKMAVRYSKYEPLAFVQQFQGLADWVWVDCFEPKPLAAEAWQYLKQHFKICLVSPELHGHHETLLEQFIDQARQLPVDAVCTKHPDRWQALQAL
jgi:hypothetical protein